MSSCLPSIRTASLSRHHFLRTGAGGWVKLAVVDTGGNSADLRFAHNPEGAVFAPRPSDADAGRAYVLDRAVALGLTPDPFDPGQVTEATLDLEVGQSFSFDRGEHVAAEESDLLLTRAAGALSALDFKVPAGVLGIETIESWQTKPASAERLFEAIVGVLEDGDFSNDSHRAIAGRSASDVWIQRTDAGGWVLVRVEERLSGDPGRVRLRYRANAREPSFRKRPARISLYSGVLFEPRL